MIINKIRNYFFETRFHFSRFQFNLVAIFFLFMGLSTGSYLTLSKIFPNVFALNDTPAPWIFSTANAGQFTTSLSVVDDTGAHPTGGTVGANKLANPDFATGTEGGNATSWSVAALPPTGWSEVPGDTNYSTTNFLVMKYDAKCDTNGDGLGDVTASGNVCNGSANADGTGDQYGTYRNSGAGCACTGGSKTVVSSAAGFPIAYIPQSDGTANNAKSYCTALGYHLITNNEWMTVARNGEAQNSNWCSANGTGCGNAPGTAGKVLANGHNDGSNEASKGGDTGSAIIASTDDTQTCYGTTTDGSNNCGGASSQKRTLTLSNNSTVWDFGGNVYNWTDNTIMGANKPVGNTNAWVEWTTISSYGDLSYALTRPSNAAWNSTQGMGQYYEGPNAGGPYAFLRGATWNNGSIAGAFALALDYSPTSTSWHYWLSLRQWSSSNLSIFFI